MQEMKLIDAVAAETAIKDFFKKQIDEEYLYLEVTDCNADISAVLNALPSVPAVPLDVHEKMKRELNTEIEAWRKKVLSEGKTTATEIRAEMYQHRLNAERIAILKEENKDLTEKLNATIAGQETLQKALAEKNAEVEKLTYCKYCEHYELMTSNNQHFCNKYGGYVSEIDCCSRGNCKRNGG